MTQEEFNGILSGYEADNAVEEGSDDGGFSPLSEALTHGRYLVFSTTHKRDQFFPELLLKRPTRAGAMAKNKTFIFSTQSCQLIAITYYI